MKLKVVQLVQGWDMRRKHELRESLRARALKRGQCLVAINVARSMARIIDCEGGVHDYYADVGGEYDLYEVAAQIERGLNVELDVGRHDTTRSALREAA